MRIAGDTFVDALGLDSVVSFGSGCMHAVPVAAAQQKQGASASEGRIKIERGYWQRRAFNLIISVRDCVNLFL
jgi:hypothetical protein